MRSKQVFSLNKKQGLATKAEPPIQTHYSV